MPAELLVIAKGLDQFVKLGTFVLLFGYGLEKNLETLIDIIALRMKFRGAFERFVTRGENSRRIAVPERILRLPKSFQRFVEIRIVEQRQGGNLEYFIVLPLQLFQLHQPVRPRNSALTLHSLPIDAPIRGVEGFLGPRRVLPSVLKLDRKRNVIGPPAFPDPPNARRRRKEQHCSRDRTVAD